MAVKDIAIQNYSEADLRKTVPLGVTDGQMNKLCDFEVNAHIDILIESP